jgi:protein SCO1/2
MVKQKSRGKGFVITIVLFGVIFLAAVIAATYIIMQAQRKQEASIKNKLPVLNPGDLKSELVDESVRDIRSGHIIGSFSLINQFGDTITSAHVKNKVFVADFFFTTCPGICITMSKSLQKVQMATKDWENFIILSHTVWPEEDSVPVLLKYAEKHDAVRGKWHFLTGSKEHIYNLARKSYFTLKPAEVGEKGDGDSDFIHTNNFVLIDQKGQIRGYYDGTDSLEVNKLLQDAHRLMVSGND